MVGILEVGYGRMVRESEQGYCHNKENGISKNNPKVSTVGRYTIRSNLINKIF